MAGEITIGDAAINNSGYHPNNYTYIAFKTAANKTGTITEVKLYVHQYMGNIKVGTFSRDGAKFTMRDSQSIANQSAGLKTITVDLDVVTGDYLGIYYVSGSLDGKSYTGSGVYSKIGDQFAAGEQTYTLDPFGNDTISMSGTGDEATTGTNAQINIGDDWKAIDAIQINIGDTWKAVAGAQVNIGDSWKDIF